MNTIHIQETLTLDSDLNSIGVIEKLIDSQSQMLNMNDEVYGKFMLSVVEAVNNAIVHGNKLSSDKKVTVNYSVENGQIIIEIHDQGDGFDPDNIPDPTSEENLEKDCGRGVFLMKHLSDELEFSDHGRCVTMKFNLE